MANSEMLSNSEIASFCSQLALLFQAGIGPQEGIALLQKDTTDSKGSALLEVIYEELEMGENFYTALVKSEVFPNYMLSMVQLGEVSGNLDNVMQNLADYYEREKEISLGIKNAVTYPFIMIAMMILILAVLISKVLPIFSQVFVQLGTEMSGFSKSLLVLGNALSKYAIVIIAVLVVLVLLFILVFKTQKGHERSVKFLSSFPLTRKFYEKIAAGRFASGMALTLSSGLDAFSSLSLTKELIDHKPTSDKIDQCKTALEQGELFADALISVGIFSSLYGRMVKVGFTTGSLDKVMTKIAKAYEEEVDERINSIISVIEPTLVIILSVIVGVILLSVILPLMGVMTSIG